MEEIEKMYQEQEKANDLFETLKNTQSMSDISDIVESMNENMSKLVLKKFIYSRGQ